MDKTKVAIAAVEMAALLSDTPGDVLPTEVVGALVDASLLSEEEAGGIRQILASRPG